jgi:1,5-anhydro-D-fructose reductase (1,5-anhydro-D-mannitol-forming)
MPNSPVRFAILGFGHHAIRRLVPAFVHCEDAALIGIWRRDQDAARKNCADLDIPHCFATREELCASDEVDAVFITSPDAMHLDDTLLALRHGKAVLCEKPLAMNAVEAEMMTEAANAAGLLFGIGQNFRWNRSLLWMREQIVAGRIGHPQLAHAQYMYPAAKAPRKWIADPTLACGGPIADVGVHCIDALRFVTGEDVVSVTTLAHKSSPEAQVESTSTLQLEMTHGLFANVTASGDAPYRTLVEVAGSRGVLIAENGFSVDVTVTLRQSGTLVDSVTVENGDGYTRMLDSFARAWRGGERFAGTAEDGVHNMRALDAAFRSVASGAREIVQSGRF